MAYRRYHAFLTFMWLLLLPMAAMKSADACPYLQNNSKKRQTNKRKLANTNSSLRKEAASSPMRISQVKDECGKEDTLSTQRHDDERRRVQNGGSFEGTPEEAIEDAKDWIADLIDDDGAMGPKFVRLGFHDCVGGCNGCVFLNNPDNAGLDEPIDELAPLADFYAPILTRADIWALAAVHAADLARQGAGPSIPFYWYGRPDCDDPNQQGNDVPMPSAHLTTSELLSFFSSNFGFNAQETVAIMGAHTLGELSEDNSGFDAPQGWVPNELRLDNRFYELLLPGGNNPNQNYQQEEQNNGQYLWRLGGGGGGGRFIMLNVDMALVLDLNGDIDSRTGEVDCNVGNCDTASTISQARSYANSNGLWLSDFRDVMVKMTRNGVSVCDMTAVEGATVGDLLDDCPTTEPPTPFPTEVPSKFPSQAPTTATPTWQPTGPSAVPSLSPSTDPTATSSAIPTISSSQQPSQLPTVESTFSNEPTAFQEPSGLPSAYPSIAPSLSWTPTASQEPSHHPSLLLSLAPVDQTNATTVTVIINFDTFPQETSWSITRTDNGHEVSGRPFFYYEFLMTSVDEEVILAKGVNYTFTINDAFGDGLCCQTPGNYAVIHDETGVSLASGGGNFGASNSTTFVP